MKRKAILLIITLSALLPGAIFSDNTTSRHWYVYPDIEWSYYIWSSNSNWEFQVEWAFDVWELYTDLDFTKDSSPSAGQIWVSRGLAEDGFCPQEQGVVACARPFPETGEHIADADIYFETDEDWDSGNCNPDPGEAARFSLALHEMGHAAGWLDHSDEEDAIMHVPIVTGECHTLGTHDIEAMDDQYDHIH